MAEIFEIVNFIRKTHLFRGLSEDELTLIAEKMVAVPYKGGEVIIRQGHEGDRFYLVYSGKVSVSRKTGDKVTVLADLVSGDHFGEDALIGRKRRTASVTALEDSTVLEFTRVQFGDLLKHVPRLRMKFAVTGASHRLARRKRFTWQEEGEVVYFVTRKHLIVLWQAITLPVLGLLIPIVALVAFLFSQSNGLLWLAGVALTVLSGWIAYQWVDWSNDYYIVTNRRVIFIEKIIFLYDSRQEAPLTAILSVNTQSDVLGRTLGYGDVIVRTFVGNVVFKTIGYPEEVEGLVREYWERTKSTAQRSSVDALKVSIRQKLGLVPVTPPPVVPKEATKPAVQFNYFKLRFEEKGVITYRKHWIVWMRQTWLPGALLLIGLGLIIRDFVVNGLIRANYILPEVVIVLIVPVFLWWLYQTLDWSNDRFQVSADQILDLDKTPLGRMQKNIAPLDNILTMEARREGLLEILFNYGNVYISVGGAQMVFEDVMNPDAVQQDIDQRRVARREKQERERNETERERLAEFFAAYHRDSSNLKTELEEKESQENPGGEVDEAFDALEK